MSEQQEIVSPTDSASNISKKKGQRPGKAQRMASRSSAPSVASASTAPSSMPLAMQFARKASYAPTPQPGKYPIVFPTGAGEPTRDSFMAIGSDTLHKSFSGLADGFIDSDRYSEFSMNANYHDDTFKRDVVVSSLLMLTQQLVHSHQNMGLPMGDFSAVSTTDISTMTTVKAIIQQFGEFSESYLGTRFLYKDYVSEVTALVRTAKMISNTDGDQEKIENLLKMHWLPVKKDDKRTAYIVAHKIRGYFQERGFTLNIDDLSSKVFNEKGDVVKTALKHLSDADSREFDVLFSSYATKEEFRAKFAGTNGSPGILDKLGLSWATPKAAHLDWEVSPKIHFPELAEPWIRKKPTFAKFFHMANGLADKSETLGTAAQLAVCTSVAGVTVVKSKIALSAPQFSLLSCFPASCLHDGVDEERVVLTTSIPVRTRAVEFQQQDWKG